MVNTSKKCVYCGKFYTGKNGEHVFPYGLGGQNIYMDCVCEQCNNDFSALELELYQKSFVGLVRSVEGVEGYNPNKRNPAPFKAPVLLIFDKKNTIVFEVGQQVKMQVFVRPQLFEVNNKFYVEADNEENRQLFADTFVKWKKENGIVIAREKKQLILIKFSLINGQYSRSHQIEKKGIKTAIQFCTLPSDHALYPNLAPRLFMNDDGKLKLRARTLTEAEVFLENLLNDTLINNSYSSFKNYDLSSPIVHVGFGFNMVKLERALIKIGLNALIHYFPQVKGHESLNPYINHVLNGKHSFRGGLDKKDQIMDSVPETHNIFFSSWRENLRIRISLFSGSFVFAFWIEQLPLLGHNEYYRLIIDYRHRQQIFQDTVAFLNSFPVDVSKKKAVSNN